MDEVGEEVVMVMIIGIDKVVIMTNGGTDLRRGDRTFCS